MTLQHYYMRTVILCYLRTLLKSSNFLSTISPVGTHAAATAWMRCECYLISVALALGHRTISKCPVIRHLLPASAVSVTTDRLRGIRQLGGWATGDWPAAMLTKRVRQLQDQFPTKKGRL
jgi:hypothetical protein